MDPVLHLRGCRVDLVSALVFPDHGDARRLTSREVALLSYLARTPGKTVTVEEIEREVWGMSQRAVSRAVSASVRRLRPKIEPEGLPQAVNLQTVHGVGWVLHLLPPPAPSFVIAPTPLPTPPFDAFVGRDVERGLLLDAIAARARLITVTGPGGVGKSRLVGEALQSPMFAAIDGPTVLYVDLDAETESDRWIVDLALALGMAISDGDIEVAIPARLGQAGALLLVLDNLDLSGDRGVERVSGWLRDCPELRVVATSRRVLRLRGEVVVRLDLLPRPVAAELFVDRLSRRGVAVDPTDSALASVVDQLGGWPLALELAAAQAATVGLTRLAQDLAEDSGTIRFSAVERDRLPRHRTLERVVGQSVAQLSEPDRRLLSSLGAFAGAFDPTWALAVTGIPQRTLWDGLTRLVDASLVVSRRDRLAIPMQLASCLAEVGEPSAEVRIRHARWVLQATDAERASELEVAARRCPDADLAAQCAVLAVDQLLQLGASKQAIRLADRVLARAPSPRLRARLGMLRLRGLALVEMPTVVDAAADALLGEPWLVADLRIEVAAVASRVLREGPQPGAVARLEQVVRSPDATPAGRALGLRVLAGRYNDLADREASSNALEQAIHIAQDHQLRDHEAWCRLIRAAEQQTVDAANETLDWIEREVVADLDLSTQVPLGLVLAQVGWIAGRGPMAANQARRTAGRAAERGQQLVRRDALILLGSILAEQGVADGATEALDEADALGTMTYMSLLARLRLGLCTDDPITARRVLRALDPFATENNALHRRAWVIEGRSEQALLAGEAWDALTFARRADALAEPLAMRMRVTPACLAARALVQLGRVDEAVLQAQEALRRAEDYRAPYDVLAALLALGEAVAQAGQTDRLLAIVERAGPLLDQLGCTDSSLHRQRFLALLAP